MSKKAATDIFKTAAGTGLGGTIAAVANQEYKDLKEKRKKQGSSSSKQKSREKQGTSSSQTKKKS